MPSTQLFGSWACVGGTVKRFYLMPLNVNFFLGFWQEIDFKSQYKGTAH